MRKERAQGGDGPRKEADPREKPEGKGGTAIRKLGLRVSAVERGKGKEGGKSTKGLQSVNGRRRKNRKGGIISSGKKAKSGSLPCRQKLWL